MNNANVHPIFTNALDAWNRAIVPVTHLAVAHGSGAACGRRLLGDNVTVDPREISCRDCQLRLIPEAA